MNYKLASRWLEIASLIAPSWQAAFGPKPPLASRRVTALWRQADVACLDLWRARMDAHHVRNQTAPVLALASRHPLVVGVPKAVNQVAAQLAHGLGVGWSCLSLLEVISIR